MNEHFNHLPSVCAYGDLFVFKLKEPGYVDGMTVEYDTFRSNFLTSYEDQGAAQAVLVSIALLLRLELEFREKQKKRAAKRPC